MLPCLSLLFGCSCRFELVLVVVVAVLYQTGGWVVDIGTFQITSDFDLIVIFLAYPGANTWMLDENTAF